jgi:osmoprotectant transport system ATP-binding protein
MIKLENLSCTFPGPVHAVKNLSLTIASGETLALLGTSGCGKSTTLKMINGLIRPSKGQVKFDQAPLAYDNIFTTRLQMGYVIQGAALFPHLKVGENISLMGRMLGWDKTKIYVRICELLELVGLEEKQYLNKYPGKLSGGEQQRVGVARALFLDPYVLLMDEPFGALDPITRRQLQDDFLALEGQMNKTIIMVTHDVEEAFKIADRVALMNDGELIQCDTPENLQKNPLNDFVSEFIKQ